MIVIYLLQELYLHFWIRYDLQTWFADVAGHSFDIHRSPPLQPTHIHYRDLLINLECNMAHPLYCLFHAKLWGRLR